MCKRDTSPYIWFLRECSGVQITDSEKCRNALCCILLQTFIVKSIVKIVIAFRPEQCIRESRKRTNHRIGGGADDNAVRRIYLSIGTAFDQYTFSSWRSQIFGCGCIGMIPLPVQGEMEIAPSEITALC